MIVDKLTAVFSIDAKGFHSSMDRMQSKLTLFRRQVGQASRNTVTGFKRLGISAAKVSAAISAITAAGSWATISLAKMVAEVDSLRRGLDFATGSAEKGSMAFSFLVQETNRLGISTATAIEQFKSMAAAAKGTTLEGEGVRNIFLAVAEASAVLGLSTERTSLVFQALQQMIAKGRITAEELRQQLGESLPMAMQAMARAVGVGTGELNKMMEAGALISTKVLPKFAQQLRQEVAPSVVAATGSMRAELERLSNAWFLMKVEFQEAKLSDELKSGIMWLTRMLRALPKIVIVFQQGLAVSAQLFGKWIEFLSPIADLFRGIGSALSSIFSKTGEINQAFVAWGTTIKQTVTPAINVMSSVLSSVADKVSRVFGIFKKMSSSIDEAANSSRRYVGLMGGMTRSRIRRKTIPDVISQAATRASTSVDILQKKLDEVVTVPIEALAKAAVIEPIELTVNTAAAQKEMEDLLIAFDVKFKALDIELGAEINRAEVEAGILSVNDLVDSMTQRRLIKLEEYYESNRRLLVEASEEDLALTQKYLDLREKIVTAGDTKLEQERASILEATRAQFEENFQDRFGMVIDTVATATRRISEAIIDFSSGVKVSFTDLFKSLIADLQRLVFEIGVIEPILARLGDFLRKSFTAMPTGGGTGIMGVLGPLFAGVKGLFGFAKGGVIDEPVAGVGLESGRGYSLGEKGPEMVTPLKGASVNAIPEVIPPLKGASANAIEDFSSASQSPEFINKIGTVAVNVERSQRDLQRTPETEGGINAAPTNVNITINAVDSKSVLDLMRQNPQAIVTPIIESLQVGNRGLTAALRGAF